MGQAFEAHGLLVFYFNLEDAASSVKKVKKFIQSGKTAIITFNFGSPKFSGVSRSFLGAINGDDN